MILNYMKMFKKKNNIKIHKYINKCRNYFYYAFNFFLIINKTL